MAILAHEAPNLRIRTIIWIFGVVKIFFILARDFSSSLNVIV